MRQKSGPVKESAEKVVKDIRRATRRQFSAEEKIRIVIEGPSSSRPSRAAHAEGAPPKPAAAASAHEWLRCRHLIN
jgi:hypothetical protein